MASEAAAENKGSRGTKVAVVVVLALAAVMFGMYFAVHRQMVHGKTMEGRNGLSQIGRGAVAAYEKDRTLCPTATPAPPKLDTCVSAAQGGTGYQSMRADWTGFACLGFEVTQPQHYQYAYERTDDGFVARANGCLPEMGTLELRGRVTSGRLELGPVELVVPPR
jgi:hypothetical protein